MTALAFIAAGTRATSAGATSISPLKPTVLGNGGKLLCVVTSKNNATHATATPGWTIVGTQVNSGANFTASLWEAVESAAAPTFTWTGSVAASARIVYYVSPDAPAGLVGAVSSNSGSVNPHTSTAIISTRNQSLFVYLDVAAANTALATPGGWTEDDDSGSATDAGRTAFGSKAAPTTGANSGAISVTGAAADWVQFQVEVRVDAPPAGFGTSKVEVGAWADPPAGLATSKAEVGAWIEPNVVGFSKVEVGAWLDPELTPVRRRQPLVQRQ